MSVTFEVGSKKKAYCRKCKGYRNCEIKGFYFQSDHNDHFSWTTEWFLLQCCGCDEVFCQTVATDSESYYYFTDEDGTEAREPEETIEYWPAKNKRQRPEWMTDILSPLDEVDGLSKPLSEVYGALDNDLTILATIGVRTVFDVCPAALGIDGDFTFKRKLEELVKLGKIGQLDQENLETLVEAGNASAHRGWLPNSQELTTILDILEHFLNVSFIAPSLRKQLDEKARKLKAKVPPKKGPKVKIP